MKSGSVLFVGAGPGDPKLLTIRGKEALERADVVIYDRLANPLLLTYVKKEAKLIYCGKEADRHTLPQDEINLLLIQEAQKGQIVVRLKGGDPSMFGRVGEEAEVCLAHAIPYEIVPGITSGMAAALYAGIPLTHRDYNSSVAFVTGHLCDKNAEKEPDWAALASVETLVIYMGVKNLSRIKERLLAHGKAKDTPVALVRWGTLREQQTVVGRLESIDQEAASAGFTAPAIIVIGEVVRLRESLNWFESRPLFGKRIAVTSKPGMERSGNLATKLEQLGAEVISIPLVESPASLPLDMGIPADFASYQWLVFDDERQVSFFLRVLRQRKFDLRQIKSKLAARGKRAADALEKNGLYPDQVIDQALEPTHLHHYLALRKGERLLYLKPGHGMVVLHSLGTVTHTVQAGELEWDQKHPAATWLVNYPVDWLATEDSYDLPALQSIAGAEWQTKPILCIGHEAETRAREMGWNVVTLEQIELTAPEPEKVVFC
ncbi:hypothetical protein BRE01_28380 [Brevibacillus reuszeri]|uniref:Uroporphyrinogen-III C-methyltransferase n=1 Tax=Brevibacillus reuszeri TaxID=54915 RepID=A0A0K9YIY6_9BACL|nr:uroporphyrinogen-III C-methyltransferase [Brevibacillus reuszeri]KNB68634.1 uroporphyrin-III methyltransferase [Brevibacillus reuszeri]MED1858923.1 uroporphyrinogen-III C-methyltransferase [Brevibacillus reuszeri]GED69136.1 hypothetical protein BRE01_28380 [Brevibacillus reuszeri]